MERDITYVAAEQREANCVCHIFASLYLRADALILTSPLFLGVVVLPHPLGVWEKFTAAKAGGNSTLTCVGVTVPWDRQTRSGEPAGDRWVGQPGPRGGRGGVGGGRHLPHRPHALKETEVFSFDV